MILVIILPLIHQRGIRFYRSGLLLFCWVASVIGSNNNVMRPAMMMVTMMSALVGHDPETIRRFFVGIQAIAI